MLFPLLAERRIVGCMSDISPSSSDQGPEEGLSLDQLSAAFARAMAGQSEPPGEWAGQPAEADASDAVLAEELSEASEDLLPTIDDQPPDDDPCELSPRSIFEAMLFVGHPENEPLTPGRAAELMRGVQADEIPALVDELNRQYATEGCPYAIVGEGSGYRLVLRRPFRSIQEQFYGRAREARLSQAAIDVLAIVAYRQPLTLDEISALRGSPSNHVVAQLVRRELLRIDRSAGKRQPAQYHTTERFLRLFGMESVEDLPQADDLDSR